MAKRKKKRTHIQPAENTDPKSFVIKSGQVNQSVLQLVRDFRRTMEPNTASRLKQRKVNRVRDFVDVAGMLSVTHLICFSMGSGLNLRFGKIPRGPTLTFRVKEWALAKDVLALQNRPKSPGIEFQFPPLVVLNNFGNNDQHTKLMTTLIQNMYPTIKITTMRLSEAKRIILYNFNKDTGLIEFRHYQINVKQIGISKSVKSLLYSQIPNLENYQDVGDFIIKGSFASESDVEDSKESTVQITRQTRTEQRAIKLVELGPRMNMELMKIEDALFKGEVMYHAYIEKDQAEIEATRKRKLKEQEERKARREQQELNVAKKRKTKKNNNDEQGLDIEQESEQGLDIEQDSDQELDYEEELDDNQSDQGSQDQ